MARELTWSRKESGALVLVGRLSGETLNVDELVAEIRAGDTLDVGGVGHITSTGVRCWLMVVRACRAAGRRFALTNCSVPFVQQMNMISDFTTGLAVRSVQAPYVCEGCKADFTCIVELGINAKKTIDEQVRCPACGGTASFDDFAEDYLSFLASSTPWNF